MTDTHIIYEQPLNERIRTFMRLDFLYRQALQSLQGESGFDSRNTITSILDIQNAFTRSDIKAETLKELERLGTVLEHLGKNPNVDAQVLNSLLDEIDVAIDSVRATKGPIGSELRTNELLNSVRQRSTIPGGTCDFDMPSYHFWLSKPNNEKITHLKEWLSHYEAILVSCQLVLKLIRESTPPSRETATEGFFQRTLDSNLPCHLIRVAIPQNSDHYAEISGGKHRFSVRFMSLNMYDRDNPTNENIEFLLTCCTL